MTISYLRRGNSVQISTGPGVTVQLTPDRGQFWLPRLIRVGAQPTDTQPFTSNQPPLTATLFHGGVGDASVDAYVDGTSRGIGDVTGVMNGTLIQPGENLTVQWNFLDVNNIFTPQQIGYLEIIGLTADTITEATPLLIASAPGRSFANPLPSPMNIPVAGHNQTFNSFFNPGPASSVTIIAPSIRAYVYIYTAEITASSTAPSVNGAFSPTGNANALFGFINPASSIGPVITDCHGMRMNSGGLQWVQLGSGAANALSFQADVIWRGMPF